MLLKPYCQGSAESNGSNDPGPNYEYCYDYYKAVIHVRYWNGSPCVNAHVRSVDMHLAAGADSNGVIKIRVIVSCKNKQNPNTKIIPFVVYNDPIPYIKVWRGDIELIKSKELEGECPDPFIEIVIK